MPRVALLAPAVLVAAVIAQVPAHLAPIAGARSHAYDPGRGVLYVTSPTGVARWNVLDRVALPPVLVGTNCWGIDITADFADVLVCDNTVVGTAGYVRRLAVATGIVTPVPYVLAFGESGAWDVAVMANGKAIVTTQYSGSGWVPLRELNLATNTYTIRTGPSFFDVRQNTQINRGGDRSLLLLLESNISSGPAFTYHAASNTFPARREFQTFHDGAIASVNRNGSLIAMEHDASVRILNPALADVTTLSGLRGGIIFHPTADRLFGVDATADVVRELDTATWAQVRSFPVGENVGDSLPNRPGELSIAADGSFLFLTTPSGVRTYEVGLPRPVVETVQPAYARFDSGPVPVTVRGRFFDPSRLAEVSVGGLPASAIQVIDTETIQCVFPADEPGPKDVLVRFGTREDVRAKAFARTPALVLGGEFVPGGAVDLRLLVTRGDWLAGFFSFPPVASYTLPWAQGIVCVAQPTLWFQLPSWPLEEFRLSTPIPNDPSFHGLHLVLQGLTIGALGSPSVLTNCAQLLIP